jgi:hypothetical protein
LSENALKPTYGNVEFQNFPGRTPVPPASRVGKGREARVEEGRGGEDGEVGREGWKVRAKGKGRAGGEGEDKKGKGREAHPPSLKYLEISLIRSYARASRSEYVCT